MRYGLIRAAIAALLLAGATGSSALAQSGGGGGGGGGTTNPAPATTGTGTSISPSQLTGSAPASTTASISAATGGIVIAGNVGLVFPSGAFGGIAGNVSVTVTATPNLAGINAGGPSQFSPNGTIMDINITDSNNVHITTFPQAITLVTKPNAADLTLAGGNINTLTLAYVIDADSPALENPNGYPINTLTIEPPSAVVVDPVGGTVSANLNALGSIIGVVTNPVGYVQTLNPDASLYSSFDPASAQTFSTQPQFSTFQVVEPQIGNRLLVIDPTTNNFAYVNSTDVGPSGPPPATSSAAVVRGLIATS